MKPAIYEMKREGWKYFFEMHVSKTRKAMLAHCKELGREAPLDTLAQLSPYRRNYLDCKDQVFAIMFLNEEHLDAGLIAHECLHAAMAYERFVNGFEMCYGDDCGPSEERLAYLMTAFIRGVVNMLNDKGHINKEPTGEAGSNTGKAHTPRGRK